MLDIGNKVKLNIDGIILGGCEGLTAESNIEGVDYMDYIHENEDTVFTIVGYQYGCSSPYVLDDECLNKTSFGENELIRLESQQ